MRDLPSPARSAAVAALLYAGVGLAWIIFSDRALLLVARTPEVYATLQTWKGGLFVTVTAGFLYLILLRQFSRRAREAGRLKRANQRLTSHVENSPLAMVEWDSDFRVSRWSPRAEELFGWSEAEVMGRNRDEWRFIVPEDRERVQDAVGESMETREVGFVSVNRNYRKDGAVLWCEWYNSWIVDREGRLSSMMSLVHDITSEREAVEEVRRLNRELEGRVRRRTAELAQANADLKALSYSISHDLRAPVRAVVGFGEILERRYLDRIPPEGRRHLTHILEAGAYMDGLIDGLMEYGRLEVDSLSMETLDPAVVAREVFEALRVAHSGAFGSLRIPDGLPEVYADRQYLRRIFQNLIGNAHRYRNPARPLEIEVTGHSEDSGVLIRIADNGPGIPAEHRERVFELFERLHKQEDVKGAGLGLAVVKRSMDLMGGRVSIDDGGLHEGEGATFLLHFRTEDRPIGVGS